MADERAQRDDDEKKRTPRGGAGAAGQASPQEVGATAGRRHDDVLDATLTPDVAREAKLKRDRGRLLE